MQPGEGDALKKVKLEDSSGTSFEFIIKGGDKAIQEVPLGTNPLTPGGARKYGDFDPSFGHIQMTSWERGWGGYDLSDDEYRFDYAVNMWTASKNNIFAVPTWVSNKDPQLNHINNMIPPAKMTSPLAGQTGYYASEFDTTNGMTPETVYVWVMHRASTGGTVKAYIYSDNAGTPNASLFSSNTYTIQDEDRYHWICVKLTFSSATALSASTTYHLVIEMDAGTGNTHSADFWLATGAGSYGAGDKSSNGSSWSFNDDFSFYLRPRGGVQRAKFFELARTPFRVTQTADGSVQLYMCGDHGTASTAGTTTTLVDTVEGVRAGWSAGQWAGDLLVIVAGTGAGQERTISTNDASGTITVSEAFDIVPDGTSEYAIISYQDWYKVTGHSLSGGISVAVAQNIAYFARGTTGTVMRRMRFNGSALQFADDSADADIVFSAGGLLWRARSDDGKIAYGAYQAWGTNITWTDLSQVTPTGFNFTGANLHGGNIYFFKEDSVWFLDPNAKILYPFPVDFSYFTGANNGFASVPAEEYLYISWGANMQRISGLSAEHINPNRDKGLPSDMRGKVKGIVNHPAGVLFAFDGGPNSSAFSHVAIYDGVGFHNAWCSEMEGVEIHDIAWHNTETDNPRLLIALGETIIVQEYPKDHTNPLTVGLGKTTQGMLETATIDMGGKVIPKFFADIVAFVEDAVYLPPSLFGEFVIFYQADGGDWTYLTSVTNISRGKSENTFSDPTLSTINALSNIRELKLRFYAIGGARCYAVTLKGFARTPIKSVYSFPIDISPVTERLGSGAPSTMLDQFWTWAMSAEALLMTSQHERLHNKTVIVIPRSIRTNYIDRSAESFAVDFYLELREV